jgi:hypothetical protein
MVAQVFGEAVDSLSKTAFKTAMRRVALVSKEPAEPKG